MLVTGVSHHVSHRRSINAGQATSTKSGTTAVTGNRKTRRRDTIGNSCRFGPSKLVSKHTARHVFPLDETKTRLPTHSSGNKRREAEARSMDHAHAARSPSEKEPMWPSHLATAGSAIASALPDRSPNMEASSLPGVHPVTQLV